MTENEYWLSQFDENFGCLKGKRIAIYGSGSSAREVFKRFPEYNFVCLVDDSNAGKYVGEYYTVTFDQMLDLEIECLIIAAKTVFAEEIYRQIMGRSRAHKLKVYNLYGQDMFKLHREIMALNIGYGKLHSKDLYHAIDCHDIIAFDMDNTLFGVRRVNKFDFYQRVEHALLDAGIEINYFANKFLEIKEVHPDWSYRYIVEKVVNGENLQPVVFDRIWDITLEVMKEDFVPRKAVLEALKYALACGKTVCIIEDMAEYRIQSELWKSLLVEHGVTGIEAIICSSEYYEDKYQGLVREIVIKYPGSTYLYVGDELEADILVPRLYGIDTFLVKSARKLFLEMEPFQVEMTQNRNVREAYENYLLEVYNDEYLINRIQNRRLRARKHLLELERKIQFCHNVQGDVHDETPVYTPVLFEPLKKGADIESYPKLIFPVCEKPKVSIIIPVYNQFSYTYNCLKSILEHSGDIAYEIIVADDNSADFVGELERIVFGITVLHNEVNLKFLLNCNKAAEHAKGEYMLFLNNDTQVQPDWLSPLVELMEQREDVGMVGSKLVYPFGCLQEAGGIL